MDHEKEERSLLAALLAMTFVSGIIDAVSYIGLGHVFAANMTGNVVIMGFALAGAAGFSAGRSALALAAFLIGAVVAGRLNRVLGEVSKRRRVGILASVEAVLLAATTVVAFAGSSWMPELVIAGLALAMGLRNGTVRALGVRDMTTTVLTLTLTGLAAESRLAGGSSPFAVRRTASVAAMAAGAAYGALLVLHHGLGWPLLFCAVLAGVVALVHRGDPT